MGAYGKLQNGSYFVALVKRQTGRGKIAFAAEIKDVLNVDFSADVSGLDG